MSLFSIKQDATVTTTSGDFTFTANQTINDNDYDADTVGWLVNSGVAEASGTTTPSNTVSTTSVSSNANNANLQLVSVSVNQQGQTVTTPATVVRMLQDVDGSYVLNGVQTNYNFTTNQQVETTANNREFLSALVLRGIAVIV